MPNWCPVGKGGPEIYSVSKNALAGSVFLQTKLRDPVFGAEGILRSSLVEAMGEGGHASRCRYLGDALVTGPKTHAHFHLSRAKNAP